MEGPDENNEIMEALILSGALELEGIDMETGQMLYHVTDKMMDVAPELYRGIEESIHRTVLSLWAKGFLSMNVMDANPKVAPTEPALDRSNWSVLTQTEYDVMNSVMRAFEGGI